MVKLRDKKTLPTLKIICDYVNMGQSDHINQMITLSVITLSGLHCIMQRHLLVQVPIMGKLEIDSKLSSKS
jgi:hypothetical protein